MKEETLAKVLCDRGAFVSFAEARRAALKGRVKVNGIAVNDVQRMVKTGDHVEVDRGFSRIIELK